MSVCGLFSATDRLVQTVFTPRLQASFTGGSKRSDWIRRRYGTDSLRRTKSSLNYRRTKNLRAIQLLLGHQQIDSTIRYLGIEVDDAL